MSFNYVQVSDSQTAEYVIVDAGMKVILLALVTCNVFVPCSYIGRIKRIEQ